MLMLWAIVLLFLGGVVLLFAEFLLPGAIMGIIGAIMIVASVVIGWLQYPEYGLFIFGGEAVGTVGAVLLGFYTMSNTRLGKVLVMESEQNKSEGFVSPSEDPELVGKLAVVQTALRPAGSILYEGRRIDAVSDGTFIDADTTVRVIEVEGHRVVCEEAVDPESEEA